MSIAMKNVYKPVGRGCKTVILKIRMMHAFQIQSMIFRRLSGLVNQWTGSCKAIVPREIMN